MELNGSGKRSSLLQYGDNTGLKKLYWEKIAGKNRANPQILKKKCFSVKKKEKFETETAGKVGETSVGQQNREIWRHSIIHKIIHNSFTFTINKLASGKFKKGKKNFSKISFVKYSRLLVYSARAVFTSLHHLRVLRMGSISWSVRSHLAWRNAPA